MMLGSLLGRQLGSLAGTKLNTVPKRYFGKYRGKVIENIDPLFLGRIMPIVPAISDLPLTWAMPCTPYAGPMVGFYAIPPISANVWIEFEGGDPDYPIWTGCFWEEGQVPLEAPAPGMTILKTESITLVLNDDPEVGGLTLEITPPAVDAPISITLNSAGIQIETEAEFQLTSQDTNITCDAVSVEAPDTNITGNVGIEGAVEIEGDVDVTGAVEIQGDVDVTGAVEVQGDVEILGAQEIQGEVNILGALQVEGDVNIAGAQQVEGVILEDGLPVMVIPI